MARFYGVDYRDRWCRDECGRRRLTLRMIGVRVKHLPADSACARILNGGEEPWSVLEYLVADVVHVLSGEPHPARPRVKRYMTPQRRRALAAGRRRAAERRRKIAAGEIV
jgi:hypothetical protein